ncbi:PAN domain protein [Devosia sp. H5989]|nr:PAN domain protein [Devosia sp. H5989]
MRNVLRSAWGLCIALCLVLGTSSAMAADRSVTRLPGTDLPGFDYSVIKDTSEKACQQACVDDRACRAYTFNTKAKWCFLKSGMDQEQVFAGANSGRIDLAPRADVTAAARIAELPFPASDLVTSARNFAAELPNTDPAPTDVGYADLVASGDEALRQSNPDGAAASYRQALAISPNDPAVWLKLARAAIAQGDARLAQDDTSSAYDVGTTAAYAALNGYLLSDEVAERAEMLGVLARALDFRQMWKESIATYRASLALVDDATLQEQLDTVVAQHGFRVVSNQVDAESATPQICAVFSDTLPNTDLSGYVVVEGAPKVAVETQQSQICIQGVEHGQSYKVKLRAGLPSANGETLRKDVELSMFVPDRSPFVGFANNAYVLPAGLGGGLPISSVNAKTADVAIYRIGDRSIAVAVRNGVFQGTLSTSSADDIANSTGEKTWEGQVDLAEGKPNVMTTTAIPIADVLTDIEPGVYVITAKVAGDDNQDYWSSVATQWFIVTDLGLATVSGEDGVHGFVRSLTSAQPVAGAKVKLVAVNNEILGETVSAADGRVDFAPGLARGTGGRAPQLLVAETDGGDYAFLDLTKPAFDLTDRGVDGRPTPGPLDLFATTERGVYRPGETVYLTALLRDTHAKAVTGLPLTMELERPDGVVSSRTVLNDKGAGGYYAELAMVKEAMRGSWTVRLYADPKANALATVNFLVEDFEPERLAFEVSAPPGPMATEEVTPISVTAKYLYGATAPGLDVEADVVLRATSSLAGFAGYTFGREDDTFETDREPLGVVGTTDESGNATAEVTVPASQQTTRPLEAQVILRLVDSNGRTVERNLTRPVLADTVRIGIRPQFSGSDGLGEDSQAGFDIVTVSPDGEAVATSGLKWTLSRVETNYQWYRDNGTWKWEAVTTNRKVADGALDTLADGPASIAAQVDYGQYLLEVDSEDTSSSYSFYAGYYYAQAGSDTPDTLKVALDKPAYRIGDTATLRLDPQFAGTAVIMVVDDRVIDMKAVEVPEGGTSVELPVTENWGPGAYVTAMLYRPSDAAEKRMPARAIGLAFADVEPGDMKLQTSIEAPAESRPRQKFTAKVALGNVAAGEKAYVALMAVDLGILNLTNFKVPDPDGWYFGQRQLGMDIRDLYGQLIDPAQGIPGAVRSGGDGASSRLGTPPATSVLVAMHSGVVEVGADGTAEVTFDMPDFNGTVRLMAVAWSDNAVGHASRDVIVRDPVVVTLSPPRLLRVGDQSRLLVELNNVSGEAGTYKVELVTGAGLGTDAAQTTFDLAVGERKALNLGLTGTALGDNDLRLLVTMPNGDTQIKELKLGVRATSAPQTSSQLLPLPPGGSITLDDSLFAGMLPHTGTVTLAIGPVARLDVPGLLLQLDRYPYGCSEQLSSRALPLLYLNEVAHAIGLGSDEEIAQRVRDAIRDLRSKQTSNGGFGLWDAYSSSDLWLDAYVTDFLLRAKAKGFDIPAEAVTMALDNLSNQVSYASDFTKGGEDIAYALYDLARAGRAAMGDLRYYMEARLDAFGSPLAKAQIGAALALYGDRTRADKAFAAAVADLKGPEDRKRYRSDYGSRLRDVAAVLALAAEFKPASVDIAALTAQLADMRDHVTWTSTQEDTWTLVAAASLAKDAGNGSVTVDGEALEGSVYRRFDQEHFDAASVEIVNNANQPTEAKVTVVGIPATPPAATSDGFTIERTYYLPDGTEADLSDVRQNDRFVVVLNVWPDALGSGQYVVADPLPAGFEIENPDLLSGAGVGDLSWLTVDSPVHTESRTDQFVAAFRYSSAVQGFTTAYMVRAVSPGTFAMPGATVEDMYRPELRANTDAGTIEVTVTGP